MNPDIATVANARLGSLLAMHRKAQNVQAEDLAPQLDMSLSALYSLEAGRTQITVGRLFQYCAALPSALSAASVIAQLELHLSTRTPAE